MPTIVNLPVLLARVHPGLIKGLLTATLLKGNLVVPETLVPKVAKLFSPPGTIDPALAVARVSEQNVVRTLNTVTFEATQFNELRAERPVPKPDTALLAAFIEKAKRDCDFCDPIHMTTEDVWGRIRGEHCVTAANMAKYDAHHGMVVFGEHDPLRFGRIEVRDYVETARRWIQETYEKSKKTLRYPFVTWNCLGSAGASQAHGHMQILTNPCGFYGRQGLMVSCAESYRNQTKRDYIEDWVEVHRQVELAHDYQGVRIVATMTPVKEKEVVIVAKRDSKEESVADAIAMVLRTYVDALGVLSFNVGLYLPPLGDDAYPLPLIARCVDRGDPSPMPAGKAKTADVGGMELYGSSVVTTDPYRVIDAVRKEIDMQTGGT